MLNRIFYISAAVLQAGAGLAGETNVFMSLYVNPSDDLALQRAYRQIAGATGQYGLTLDIKEPLSGPAIRFIVSFVMLPAYTRVDGQPVINIAGNQAALLDSAAGSLQSYLGEQELTDTIINKLVYQKSAGDYYRLIQPGTSLQPIYRPILRSDRYYENSLFIMVRSVDELNETYTVLKNEENDFATEFPRLAELANSHMELEKKLRLANIKCNALAREWKNQQDYNALLRSEHSTQELQTYYNNEYEILPTWYKRFGHVLKVIMGKRTFRSLFRDDVKKYKK